jgi:outer membrane protein W
LACNSNLKIIKMRKAISVALFVLGVTTVGFAQEQGKFRVGLDFGYAMPDGGGGVLVALEPKYNIADDMNLGLRFESAAMGKNISGGGLSIESEVTASTAILGTFDKYFNNGSSSFAPFVGAGIGYNTLANIEVEVLESTSEAEVDGKLGGFL